MDDRKSTKPLGTKWFTFYAKIRPWIGCLAAFSVVADFVRYQEVYMSYWWLMVFFLATVAQIVLHILVFVKSSGEYEKFVRFVNGVLIFEVINTAYGQAVQQYAQTKFQISNALITGIIVLVLGYFLWYCLNIRYFKKRIGVITNDYLPDDPNRLTECKSCGYRDRNFFDACPKCGQCAKQYVYLNDGTGVNNDEIEI